MEEILSLFGFSLGASVGIGAVRAVTDGTRPLVREMFKAGIRAWDSVSSNSTSVHDEIILPESASQARRGGRRRSQPEKIIIAHD
ncbi:MAG: hypothetical protein JO057_22015 [Chloroflexi bacterium]|nr:hypothetical protein [Chloroflexota bacterium]